LNFYEESVSVYFSFITTDYCRSSVLDDWKTLVAGSWFRFRVVPGFIRVLFLTSYIVPVPVLLAREYSLSIALHIITRERKVTIVTILYTEKQNTVKYAVLLLYSVVLGTVRVLRTQYRTVLEIFDTVVQDVYYSTLQWYCIFIFISLSTTILVMR